MVLKTFRNEYLCIVCLHVAISDFEYRMRFIFKSFFCIFGFALFYVQLYRFEWSELCFRKVYIEITGLFGHQFIYRYEFIILLNGNFPSPTGFTQYELLCDI